jgi:chromosome partitioning protein
VRTIAIVNQKGGCGKTTTAINLAAVYARRGLRTLLIDVDPQGHCAAGLGVPEKRIETSIGDAMLMDLDDGFDRTGLVWEVARNLDLAPSTVRLAALEAPGGGLHELPDKDRRLERVLEKLADGYDRCLIDCPPTIGLLTFNALRAARETLIPVETGYFALKGAQKQWETVQRVIRHIGRPIACHILPTLHDPKSELAEDILAALRRQFAGQIMPIVIREHGELREAASRGQAVLEYAPDSDARQDFEALADWLAEHAARPVVELDIEDDDAGGDEASAASTATVAPGLPFRGETPEAGGLDGGRAGELAARLRELRLGGAASGIPPSLEDHHEERTGYATTGAPPAAGVALGVPGPPTIEAVVAPTHRSIVIEVAPPEPVPPRAGRELYGVRTTSRGVLFVQPGDGRVIRVAGDFNGWRPDVTPLTLNHELGVCEAVVPMEPGRHRYRLVVDGRWQADPYNALSERNEHGEVNSIVIVPEREAVR